jgi:hypothetical protein
MKTFNDYHLTPYTARAGDGTRYFYLDHIEIDDTGITVTIIAPHRIRIYEGFETALKRFLSLSGILYIHKSLKLTPLSVQRGNVYMDFPLYR